MKETTRFYPDTSIFIDFFESRGENGEHARKFFEKVIKEDLIILYSDQHIKEFKNFGYSYKEIIEMFNFIKNNSRKVHIYREEKELAKKIASQRNVPKGDALYAILARNNEAQLVSRDKHFWKLINITIFKKPEDITN